MKKWMLIGMSCMLILSGCGSKSEEEVKQEDGSQDVIIPKYSISDEYYKMALNEKGGFEVGEGRGLVVSNLNNHLDVDHFEESLMRIAQESFPTDTYYFESGKKIKKETITNWLARKLTDEQVEQKKAALGKDEKKKEIPNEGLNPADPGEGTLEERNSANPRYLAHILEQNYMKKGSNGQLELGGVVIGLAMNSVHYFKEENDYPREVKISDKDILENGKKMADTILESMRKMDELGDVPITFVIYKQQPKNALIPGTMLATAEAKGSSMGKWEAIDEQYYLFPSEDAERDHKGDFQTFVNFKADVEKYFPNFTGVIGKGFYQNNDLKSLTIDIPMRFYGQAEVIAFTQYVTGLIMQSFPNHLDINVYIRTTEGPKSLIVKEKDAKEPYVHIYD
ncbi:CamS family sex pheromone protein [Priestia taiwanensis]|uniref:Lipoprotein YerH n=1 Tax=Priestia taiwanensis TaxID=1347902 RepID=A0A917AW85_9BACI|nr:CamS family sex pheromone protein [Priestia taiwanensis]MBM7364817.1 protein involved in sex pheromone biosynthesis [Priestia taiwanensis]GGE79926.1 putative lipoprotein YerH [Priestia taiwanensis]